MTRPVRFRCPQCRTRRVDGLAMLLHVMKCTRPVCHCGSYAYPHRPAGGLCTLNPDVQVALASRAGTPDHELPDVADAVAFSMRGKAAKVCPF